MTQTNHQTTPAGQPMSVVKPMLIGAGIAFFLISFFVFGVDEPNPEWPANWQVKPLILTPLAGAMGGLFVYFMDYLSFRGLNRTVALIVGVIGFLIALWMGTVLGLNGTMWN